MQLDHLHKVGVILLNWNGKGLTIPCIKSLLTGSFKPDKIYVLDNASEDGSADEIEQSFPRIEIIRSLKNLGFAAGNNVAAKKALEEEFDYIWILNNDTIVGENCLKILYQTMESNTNIAASTGKILYDNPNNMIWYAGASFNNWTFRSKHRGRLEIDTGQYDTEADVPFISGCSMFLRKEAWIEIGQFDERFFAYSEDLDWCIRVRKKGLKLRYIPKAIIYHKVSASFNKTHPVKALGKSSLVMTRISQRNRLFIIKKHWSSIPQLIVAGSAEVIWVLCHVLGLLLLCRFTKLNSLWRGVVEGLS